MRATTTIVSFLCLISGFILSCKKDITNDEGKLISETIKNKVLSLGFSTEAIEKIPEGYLVEGDIILTAAQLDQSPRTQLLTIAGNEHYRSFNLVTRLPRAITISLSNKFPSAYGFALDEAIRRFNDEGLQIHFQRVSNNADIDIVKANGNFFAASGFPTASGIPFTTIKLNSTFIGQGSSTSVFINYLATIITHELGHCIGFRHTDYMDRSFSCTGRSVNEGANSMGAVHIPGTPSAANEGSWMLVCISPGQNRLFNSNDVTALNYLY